MIDIQLYDSRVGTACTSAKRAAVTGPSTSPPEDWLDAKSTTTSWTESPIVWLFCPPRALQTPLCRGTHWATCVSSTITLMLRHQPFSQRETVGFSSGTWFVHCTGRRLAANSTCSPFNWHEPFEINILKRADLKRFVIPMKSWNKLKLSM